MTAADDSERTPLARRVRGMIATVLAVTFSLAMTLYVMGVDTAERDGVLGVPTWLAVVSLFAGIGAAVALTWRHSSPLLVTGITLVPPLLLTGSVLAALVALAALAASRRDRLLWLASAAVLLASVFVVWRDARRAPGSAVQSMFGAQVGETRADVPFFAVVLFAAVLTAIPLAVGLLRGARREVSRGERKEYELRSEMARRDERTRIAREMHDVLGHRLSLLSLQAGALEVSQDEDSGRATEAARTVRGTSRAALDDLRRVIGVLRDGRGFADGGADDRAGEADQPAQPTLADIPQLIDSARGSGLALNVAVLLDDPTSAPPRVAVAGYRILQESLTNVLRHAPASTGDVTVRGGPGTGLTVEVGNAVPDTAVPVASAGSGTGLTGIAERVAQLDGTVSSGPTGDGRFAVAAWLPWPKP